MNLLRTATTTSIATNPTKDPPLWRLFVLIPLLLVCFGLLPSALATDTESVLAGNNTADGRGVLINRTTSVNNAGFGFQVLNKDTTGSNNAGFGFEALNADTTGSNNTGTGFRALYSNTTGANNTATGVQALLHNTKGNFNTANGQLALFSNTEGTFNSAVGQGALASNTLGNNNTANGAGALFNNTIGTGNTAAGFQALNFNNSGSANTAIGYQALDHNITGSGNIALGLQAGHYLTSGDNNIEIGNLGSSGESNAIRIGTQGLHENTYIAGIFGTTVINAVDVMIDNNGRLGTIVSSQRFKEEIKPMDEASQALFALKPVSFRYKKEIDPAGTSQLGLVAEDVEKVNPDLVVRDKEGKAYSVRYDQVNAMLLNEFLKEHRKNEEQQTMIARLESTDATQEAIITQLKSTDAKQEATIARQQKQIEALTAGLQKVSAELELNKPAPRTVLNNP